ncbi:hypothetical protein PAXRUDRAFT_136878 [Paxillus rubicundulus Ve08.2h10]|uniref:Unplaced genomic scaffold scaffold_128, whole genome shotgun sequence n=1 Tax=Paxillus rubicundulus Ve08.2h10 TaxID=930991 RepID=A0A0D0E6K7_9AGAM|nr:hypothetical protein PAXRUDRAFT_136878 [Paxillus rubicundulus Ve08.2h10]
MALFTEHPFRHVMKAIFALVVGHVIMKMMPHSIRKAVIHLTQTSVTVLAIGALIFLQQNQRAEGQALSQNHQELILIGAFGAFWLAFLLAMRAFNHSSVDIDLAHPTQLFSASSGTAESNVVGAGGRRAPAAYNAPPARAVSERNAAAYGRPKTGYRREHPCNPYDEYCVTEEWAFY